MHMMLPHLLSTCSLFPLTVHAIIIHTSFPPHSPPPYLHISPSLPLPSPSTHLPRSATLVIAYLMRHEGKSLHEAHSFLKERRPFIRPNFGFWKQLIDYEYHLFQKNTITMIKWKDDTVIPDVYWEEYKNLY